MAPVETLFRPNLVLYITIIFLCCLMLIRANSIAFIDFQRIVDTDNKAQLDDVFLQLQGSFLATVPSRNLEGELVTFSNSDCNEEIAPESLSANQKDWIAVFHHTITEDALSHKERSRCANIIERIRRMLLLGASAVLVLVMRPATLKEIDISQTSFGRPVIFITGAENITQVLAIIWSQVRTYVKVTFNASFYGLEVKQVASSWSSCGRAQPGSGVVCEPDESELVLEDDVTYTLNYILTALASATFMMLMRSWSQSDAEADIDTDDRDATESLHLTWHAITLMGVKRYRSLKRAGCDESCAICLDKFHQKDHIRVLPCAHKFHMCCADVWLLQRPVCPLCKRNIVEEQLLNSYVEGIAVN